VAKCGEGATIAGNRAPDGNPHEVDVTSVTIHTAEDLMRDSGVSFNDAYGTAAFIQMCHSPCGECRTMDSAR
jgi:hypothetical protein